MGLVVIKFFREIIIVFLTILLVISLAILNYRTGQLKIADQKCNEQIQKIERAQVLALAKEQSRANKVSADYEKLKSEQRTKVETVTHTVQKIIERPVYKSVCIDDDGLQQINSLIEAGNTS